MRFGLIFSLVLAIVAVIFALQNPQPMDVNLLFVQTEGSTALVLILSFGFGVLVGLLSSLPGRLRARRQLKELQKKQDPGASSRPSSPSAAPPSNRSEPGGSSASS
jgi:putative membrane protein